LTGVRLGAADLILSGIATHYVPSERLGELEDALSLCPDNHEEARAFAQSTIERYAVHPSSLITNSQLHKHAAAIK
jgi:hypothetical protein